MKNVILRCFAQRSLEGRTSVHPANSGALSALAATVLFLLPAVATAQVDCDRYSADSATRNSCNQTEYWRSHDDLQRAEDRQHAVDRYTGEQRYDTQRDRERAAPSNRGDRSGSGNGGYRYGDGDEDDDR